MRTCWVSADPVLPLAVDWLLGEVVVEVVVVEVPWVECVVCGVLWSVDGLLLVPLVLCAMPYVAVSASTRAKVKIVRFIGSLPNV